MNQSLRILFIEDLPTDQELAAWQLREGGLDFTSLRVETQDAFLQALEVFQPDLIISDYSMPEFDGMRALKLTLERKQDIPFIVLTGSMNEETAAECIKAGASDYVIKEHIQRLPFAVQEALNQQQIRKEKTLAEESLRESEIRYHSLFEDSPVSLWEEDFSAVNLHLDKLRASGVKDFNAYFAQHPEEILALIKLVKVVDVNKATLELYGAPSKEELLKNFAVIIPAENFENIRNEFVLIASGITHFNQESVNRTFDGRLITVKMNWAAIPGYGNNLSKVIVSMVDITASLQAAEQIRLQATALNSTANAIVITDREGIIEWVNPAYTLLTGYSFEEVIGKNPRILKSGRQGQPYYKDLWDTILAGEVWRGELVNKRKNGSLYDEEETITPLIGPDRQIEHFIGIKVDVTQRKQDVDALKDANTKLNRAQRIAHIGSWSIYVPTTRLEWSDEMYRIFGIPLSTPMTMPELERYFPPEEFERFNMAVRAAIKDDIPFNLDYKINFPDGSVRYIHDEGEVVRDEGGKPIWMHGAAQDITERKQAEEALKEEQFLTRTLMDTIPDTIYFKDIQGHFIRINQAQAQKLGVSDIEQVLGKTDFDFFTPEHAQAAAEDEEQIIKTGLPLINSEEQLTYPDRPSEWVSATKFPLRDLNGQIVGTFGVSRDISNLKQAEARLLFQSEELQKRNSELARLYRISESLISPKPFDLHGLAQAIVDIVVREFDIQTCCLYLRTNNTNELARLACAGEISENYLAEKLTIDGPGIIALAIRTRQVLNVADVNSHPDYIVGWDGTQSELVIPLFLNEVVIGAINLESAQLSNFTSDDEKLLQTFANQAAIVLENTNLIEETNLQVQRLNSLRIIDGAINSSLDITLTASVLLEQITNQLNVDAADILLFNPFTKSLQFVNSRGFITAALQRTDLRLGQGLAGRAASEREIVHISDLSIGDEFFKNSPAMKEENFVEYYGVPLISKGSIKGFLEIFHRSRLKADPSWLSFMGTLAEQAAIAIDNIRMFEDLQKSNDQLTLAYDATIEGWSRALDLRDQETEGHTRRVTNITMRLAKAIGIQGEELVQIWRGALLHDIGKMGISDNILLKPEALTVEEWITMRKHPVYAFDLLSPISFLKLALDIPYCHHEKWDGSGYPRGLKGEQIPLSARLFAVGDVWDALTSDRPYRKAWSESQAIEYIREQAGKQFDPQAIELFMNNYLFEESPMVKPTILIVDDEESVTRSLARSLKDHFTILTANSGEDALRIAERSDLAVVLTDQRMPGMSGVELLERIRAIKPKSVGILISGYSDVVALTAAINLSNVRGFIPKPWDLDSLRRKLEDAVAQYREMSRGFTIQE